MLTQIKNRGIYSLVHDSDDGKYKVYPLFGDTPNFDDRLQAVEFFFNLKSWLRERDMAEGREARVYFND